MKYYGFVRRFLRLFVTILVVLSVFTLTAFAEEVSEATFDWQLWFRDTALPMLIAFLSAAAVNYFENLPLMLKIKSASGKFESSAKNVNAVVEASIEHQKRLENDEKDFRARFAKEKEEWMKRVDCERKKNDERVRMYEEYIRQMQENHEKAVERFMKIANTYADKLQSTENRLTTLLDQIAFQTGKTEKMVYLGFTNQSEMVTNGSARRIAEIAEIEEDEIT